MFGGSHPSSRKFNAGQKLIFWAVMLGGLSLSLSGLQLIFPFTFSFFDDTFGLLNMLGFGLPTDLTPMAEQQLATVWHGSMAVFLIAVMIAHVYIGTLGMEGAFEAMGTGDVDLNWAREHHDLWVEELERKGEIRCLPNERPTGRAERRLALAAGSARLLCVWWRRWRQSGGRRCWAMAARCKRHRGQRGRQDRRHGRLRLQRDRLAAGRRERPAARLLGHDGPVNAVALTADGRTAARRAMTVASAVWDVATGTLRRRLRRRRSSARSRSRPTAPRSPPAAGTGWSIAGGWPTARRCRTCPTAASG